MPILGIAAAGGLAPGAPTIGTATDGGTGTSASVTFTAPTWPGKGSGTVTYTATSSPGSFTGTSTSSPVTVSGLTAGTAYTFTVKATTSYGVTGPSSAASNSVTPAVPGAFDSIASVVGNNTSATITFSGIPQTYAHLQVRASWITSAGAQQNVWFIMNGNTGSVYNTSYIMSDLSGGSSLSGSYGESSNYLLGLIGGSSLSGIPGVSILTIADYSITNKRKNINTFHGVVPYSAGGQQVKLITGSYESNDAITDLSFSVGSGNFTYGTVVSLYGIRSS